MAQLNCPMLVLACKADSVAPVRAAALRAGNRAELKEYYFGHFDIYVGAGFERSSGDALAFFQRIMPARQG